MKNITPPAAAARRNQIIAFAIAVIVLVLLFRACAPHENKYEKIADQLTVALQQNNVDEVRKYQNAETAAQVNRRRVGQAADFFAPLGKLKSVHENTPKDSGDRNHQFLLTFDKGQVVERMHFDPDDKIVTFAYKPASEAATQ